MAIRVMTAEKGGEGASPLKAVSHLSLEVPTDVTLGPDAGRVAGYVKQGGDLHLRMEDGEILHIRDFFVIGPNGDFSRLISQSGEPLATGLMAPEPEDLTEVETTGVFADQSLPNAAAADAGGPEIPPQDSGQSGGDWGSVLVGAGLPLGAGIGLVYAGGNDDPVADAETAAAGSDDDTAGFAADVEALTRPESEVLVTGWHDDPGEVKATGEQDHTIGESQLVEPEPAPIEVDGGLAGTGFPDMEFLLSDPATDFLSELVTETPL